MNHWFENWPNWFFWICIGYAGYVTIIRPIGYDVPKFRETKTADLIRNPTVISLFLSVLVTILAQLCLNLNQERESLSKEKLAKQESLKKERDLINTIEELKRSHKSEIQESIAETEKNFAEGFAKYGLMYIKANNEIRKLISDSAKKTIVENAIPDLGFDLDPINCDLKYDTLKYKINMISKEAPSISQGIVAKVLIIDRNDNMLYIASNKLSNKGSRFPTNIIISAKGSYSNPIFYNAKRIIIQIVGKYRSLKGDIMDVDEIATQALYKQEASGTVSADFENSVREYLNKIGK